MVKDITEKMRVVRVRIISDKLNHMPPEKISSLAGLGIIMSQYVLHWDIPSDEVLMKGTFEDAYIRMVENAVLQVKISEKLGFLYFEGEFKAVGDWFK